MAGTTSVPTIQFTSNGVVLPEESAIRAGVYADWNAALGGNLNPSPETAQGQLITSQTAIIGDKNNQFAYFVNQIDPATAEGVMQDAIGRIYFLDRLPARPTLVDVVCAGLTGVTIPIGALVQDSAGNQYASTAAATIPESGTVTTPFAAVVPGPTPCPVGAISGIYQSVAGWDSATNTTEGIIGAEVESRADFEYRRQLSVAINAQNSLQAIYANVINVDGVTDAYCTENVLDTPITIGTVTLAAHSLWACVAGGAAADIAHAIWSRKSLGCNYNGTTTVTVNDTSYNTPYPQYTVKFQVAAPTPVKFAVQIANSTLLPPDATAKIKAAIIDAFAGGDGGPRARIASTIYAGRFYAPVLAVAGAGTVLQILSLKVGTSTANLDAVTLGIDQVPTISAADITVTYV